PSGATYRVLVLPAVEAMTPRLIQKIAGLGDAGAIIIGAAPRRSPSLTDYPHCDAVVQQWGRRLAGKLLPPGPLDGPLYPYYAATANVLDSLGLAVEDFSTDAPLRYTHRTGPGWDIYFVSNTSDQPVAASAAFRSVVGAPELWDANAGTITGVHDFTPWRGRTTLTLSLAPHESRFVVFSKENGW